MPGSSWPGRRPHRKTVKRGETEGALDALAARDCAHGGAAAKMRDDHSSSGDFRSQQGQTVGDIFVRQAMKPVTADAFSVELIGKSVAIGDVGVAAMESRVEAGHL